jgi:DNA primase small subunit
MVTSILHQEQNNIIKSLFKSYYSTAQLIEPEDIEMREFAIQPFDSESYIRHLSFSSVADLKSYIMDKIPLHVYYSTARYALPAARDMEEKGWLGSDLLFDIDADEICKDIRRINFCSKCGNIIEGSGTCPYDSTPLSEYVEIDDKCFLEVINNVKNLVELLEEDFEFKPIVIFSGSRGFHVRINCKDECGLLDSEDRKELVEYVKGEKVPNIKGTENSPGWLGRKAKGINSIIIDEQVTIDIRRLERVENSLNGKSGLLVKRIENLDEFKFDDSLSPFSGYTVVIPKITAKIKVLNMEIEMVRNIPLKVDASIGVYLHLKNVGELRAYVR